MNKEDFASISDGAKLVFSCGEGFKRVNLSPKRPMQSQDRLSRVGPRTSSLETKMETRTIPAEPEANDIDAEEILAKETEETRRNEELPMAQPLGATSLSPLVQIATEEGLIELQAGDGDSSLVSWAGSDSNGKGGALSTLSGVGSESGDAVVVVMTSEPDTSEKMEVDSGDASVRSENVAVQSGGNEVCDAVLVGIYSGGEFPGSAVIGSGDAEEIVGDVSIIPEGGSGRECGSILIVTNSNDDRVGGNVTIKSGSGAQGADSSDLVLGSSDVAKEALLGSSDVTEEALVGSSDVTEEALVGSSYVTEEALVGFSDVTEEASIVN